MASPNPAHRAAVGILGHGTAQCSVRSGEVPGFEGFKGFEGFEGL